jgi:hypothetical protein
MEGSRLRGGQQQAHLPMSDTDEPPEPGEEAQARRAETLRLLNARVQDDRTAWVNGGPTALDKKVRQERAAAAAAAAGIVPRTPRDVEAVSPGEDVALVEAAGIPEGDPLGQKQHVRELRCARTGADMFVWSVCFLAL